MQKGLIPYLIKLLKSKFPEIIEQVSENFKNYFFINLIKVFLCYWNNC